MTKGHSAQVAGVPAHGRCPLIHNGDEPVQKDPGSSSAPMQKVGDQALGGLMESHSSYLRGGGRTAELGDLDRGHPPTAPGPTCATQFWAGLVSL